MNKQHYIERYWRDATPEDAIKEPPMVARFKTDSIWAINKIIGFRKSEIHKWLWYDSKGELWTCCQVYDAPDPGEGWRLIDPDKDDYSQDGIDFWYPQGARWCSRASVGRDKQRFTIDNLVYYRIRTTPAVTYVPFTWEDREQLRGRWIGSNDGRCERLVNVMHHDSGCFYANAMNATSLCADWHFRDTGEPVGKKVQ